MHGYLGQGYWYYVLRPFLVSLTWTKPVLHEERAMDVIRDIALDTRTRNTPVLYLRPALPRQQAFATPNYDMSFSLCSPLGVHRLTLAPCKQSKSYPIVPGTPQTSPEGPAYVTQST